MSRIPVNHQADNDDIDIKQIANTLWASKWLIIIFTIIAWFLGNIYGRIATPIYEANSLLQIEAKSSGFAGLTGLSDAFGGGDGAGTSTELQLLKSRKVMSPTVRKFNLELIAKPLKLPLIGNYYYRTFDEEAGFRDPVLSQYFNVSKEYAWGGEKIVAKQFDVPKLLYGKKFEIIALEDGKYKLLADEKIIFEGLVGENHHVDAWGIDIEITKLLARPGTYFTIAHIDPIVAVQALTNRLIIEETGSSDIVFIKMKGADKAEIRDLIKSILLTYQQQNVDFNNVEASRSLNFVRNQLPNSVGNMKDAEQEIYEYRLTNNTVDLSQKTQQLLAKLLNIEASLNDLEFAEPELSRKFKAEHPIYIEFLRRRATLLKKKAETEQKAADIPTEQFNLFKLQRNVEITQKTYLQTLNRYEELRIIQAGTTGSIRIIDEVVVHPAAIQPRRSIISIVSIFLGLFSAIGIILARASMSKKITHLEQFNAVGAEIIVSVPVSQNQQKLDKAKARKGEVRVLSHLNPDDAAVEAYRSLRTRLHFGLNNANTKSILISGSNSEIDSTIISQNLAVLFAQSGLKTLLIDANMRNGNAHDNIGVNSSLGLTEFLSGKTELNEVSQNTKVDNLDFIACGLPPRNPSELLMSKKFSQLCDTENGEYEYIIINAPSFLAYTDTSIISQYVGASLVAIKRNVTQFEDIEKIDLKLAAHETKFSGYIYSL
ncbi:MAG: polysaccharide biosynthesis tyrosine autokinase [Alphaproteobacteria bacterium]|nr:polysaccharide biosynthesis tyrosine autokinase [Alphaproteobacteria bacterium]